ncbi:hypothetical protein KCU98_g252, partial [Aureobasidium melanogenum]
LSLELLERRVLVVRVCADAFKRLDFGVCVFGRSEFKAGRRRHDVPGAIIVTPELTNPDIQASWSLCFGHRHATSGILLDQMSQERSSVV